MPHSKYPIALAVPFLFLSTLLQLHAASPAGVDSTTLAQLQNQTCEQLQPDLAQLNARVKAISFDSTQRTTWLYATGPKPKAIVLMIHGLNSNPGSMDVAGKVLTDSGADVLRVALSGHRRIPGEINNAKREQWLKEVFLSYCVAKQRSSALGVPLHVAGFSMGGALAQDLTNTSFREKPRFDRAIFFAPALLLRPHLKLAKALEVFGNEFMLKSSMPECFLADKGFNIAGYKALLDSQNAVEKSGMQNSNIPTLVFMDKKDELVDFGATRELIRAKHLDSWKLEEIKSSDSAFKTQSHHYIIDPRMVGPQEWERMKTKMVKHLFDPA